MADPQLERHAASFGRVADAYDRGRPPYPPAAVVWLTEELGVMPTSAVLDLAAGTGKLTASLVPLAGRVIAVEPVAEMRRVLETRRPAVEVLAGRAEAIPLPDRCVDAVFVAAAFHWFDADAALREIHRVLRPGGGLGLLWNRPEWEGEPWYADFTTMLGRTREDQDAPNRYVTGEWRAVLERSTCYGPVSKREFRHVHRVTRDGFLARVASWSVFAVLADGEREELLGAVAGLLDGRGIAELELRYRTDTYRVRARP
jgi:ubiquinone/menaquinone biosynthesis C-methylase UbiE